MMEVSAKNVGSDIAKLKSNAQRKARLLRGQSSINQKVNRGQFATGMLQGIAKTAGGLT